MKLSFSLAGGTFWFSTVTMVEIYSRGPELAGGLVLALVSHGGEHASSGLVSLCSSGFKEWVLFAALAIHMAQLVEPACFPHGCVSLSFLCQRCAEKCCP